VPGPLPCMGARASAMYGCQGLCHTWVPRSESLAGLHSWGQPRGAHTRPTKCPGLHNAACKLETAARGSTSICAIVHPRSCISTHTHTRTCIHASVWNHGWKGLPVSAWAWLRGAIPYAPQLQPQARRQGRCSRQAAELIASVRTSAQLGWMHSCVLPCSTNWWCGSRASRPCCSTC